MAEGIKELFEGTDLQNLSEDFKTKIKTIFEAAVSEKVAQIKEELIEEQKASLQEQAEEAISGMEEKIDEYLTYIADEWMKENELAVDKGIAVEISESFLSGLKTLFEEHYVTVPEDKVDVVSEMLQNVDELEESKNEAVNENINLKKELAKYKKAEIIRTMSEDLADSERDKLIKLVSEIIFEDEESFKDKVATIAETFLGKTLKEDDDEDDGDDGDGDGDENDDEKEVDEKKKKGKNESVDIVSLIAERMNVKGYK